MNIIYNIKLILWSRLKIVKDLYLYWYIDNKGFIMGLFK